MSLNIFKHLHSIGDEPFGTVLGITDGGVEAYSCDYNTAPSDTQYDNYVNGEYTGYKYQCVELARRYLLINKGVVFESIRMAYQIFQLKKVRRVKDNKLVPMKALSNGSKERPVKGSLVIWNPRGFFTETGHVAVVVNVGDKHVDVVEQNVIEKKWPRDRNYSRRLPAMMSSDGSFTITCTFKDTQILGWMNIEYEQSFISHS